MSIPIIAQPIPQSPSFLAHRSVTHVQHILIRLVNDEELTYFSFLNTLLRLSDPLRDVQPGEKEALAQSGIDMKVRNSICCSPLR